jgi:hypothetical protein
MKLPSTNHQCHNFGATLLAAIALLTQAMDAGTFRFSFFLPEIVAVTEMTTLEDAMRRREAQLALDFDESGTHDLLTGRLLV